MTDFNVSLFKGLLELSHEIIILKIWSALPNQDKLWVS